MKRSILLFLVFQCIAFSVFAQSIKVTKGTLVAKETGIYHANQAAALNTKTGQTLVVWQKLSSTTSVILGRLVNAQGNPSSGAIQLSTTGPAAHPAVTYNPARNEYLIAYDNNPNVKLTISSVFVRRINVKGQPAADEVTISTDTVSSAMANFYPKLVFNPKTGAYTTVWLREITSTSQSGNGTDGMVGALLDAAGAPGPVTMVQKTVLESTSLWGPITMDVLIHPANGKLIVAFVQVLSGTGGSQANYYLATLDPAFNGISASNIVKINNAPLQLTAGFAWAARLALFKTTPGFAFYVDSGNIKRRKIDLQGKLTGAAVVAFKPPKNNTRMVYPAVAFSTNSKGTRGLLIAAQDAFSAAGAASTWAQVLDATGAPLGAPVRVDVTSSTDTALSAILTALPLKPADTFFRFTSYYTLAQFTSPGQTYQSSGIVKLNLNVTVP